MDNKNGNMYASERKNKLILIIVFIAVLILILTVVLIVKQVSKKSFSNNEETKILNNSLTKNDIEKINSLELNDTSKGIIFDMPPGNFGSWLINYNVPKKMNETIYSFVGSDQTTREYRFEDYLTIELRVERDNFEEGINFDEYKLIGNYENNNLKYEIYSKSNKDYYGQLQYYRVYILKLQPTDENSKYKAYGNIPEEKKNSYLYISFKSKYNEIFELEKFNKIIKLITNIKVSENFFSNTVLNDNNWLTGLYDYYYDKNYNDQIKVMMMDINVPKKYNPILFYSSNNYLTYQIALDDVNFREIAIYLKSENSTVYINEVKDEIKTITISNKKVKYGYYDDSFVANIKLDDNFYYEIVITNHCEENNKIETQLQCNKSNKLTEDEINQYLTDFTNYLVNSSYISVVE